MTSSARRPERIYAVVGPSICPEHYEVPDAMRVEVAALAPGSAATTTSGTPALDIRAGLLAQLHDGGVRQGWSCRSAPRESVSTPIAVTA